MGKHLANILRKLLENIGFQKFWIDNIVPVTNGSMLENLCVEYWYDLVQVNPGNVFFQPPFSYQQTQPKNKGYPAEMIIEYKRNQIKPRNVKPYIKWRKGTHFWLTILIPCQKKTFLNSVVCAKKLVNGLWLSSWMITIFISLSFRLKQSQ